jgi:hypothetical protein
MVVLKKPASRPGWLSLRTKMVFSVDGAKLKAGSVFEEANINAMMIVIKRQVRLIVLKRPGYRSRWVY